MKVTKVIVGCENFHKIYIYVCIIYKVLYISFSRRPGQVTNDLWSLYFRRKTVYLSSEQRRLVQLLRKALFGIRIFKIIKKQYLLCSTLHCLFRIGIFLVSWVFIWVVWVYCMFILSLLFDEWSRFHLIHGWDHIAFKEKVAPFSLYILVVILINVKCSWLQLPFLSFSVCLKGNWHCQVLWKCITSLSCLPYLPSLVHTHMHAIYISTGYLIFA